MCGKRETIRRKDDVKRYLYVDRYSTRLFVLIMIIIALGIADAWFTLYHIQVHDAVEVNPLMRFFLGIGPHAFFHVKYLLTAACVLVLCLHKNMPVVRVLLVVIVLLYLLVIAHHLYLFRLAR